MIREQMLFTTVAQKLNQGTQPENGPFRSELDEGSGRLFWYFFGEAKKYKDVWAFIYGFV